MFWKAATLVVAAFVISRIASFAWHQRRRARLARDWGCLPPRQHVGSRLSFSFSPALEFSQAAKELRIPAWLCDVHARAGGAHTFSWAFPDGNLLATSEPQNMQALLATQFKDFDTGDRALGLAPLFGKGIFTTDGEDWKHSRALLRPQFVRDQVADLQVEEGHVAELMQHLPPVQDGWSRAVDLKPLLFRLSLDSACEFLFGESPHSQRCGLPGQDGNTKTTAGIDAVDFQDAFDRSTVTVATRIFLGKMCWLYNPKQYKDDTKLIHAFVDYYVNLGLRSVPIEDDKTDDKTDGKKGKYVFLHEMVKQTRDPVKLRNELLNILLAGRDTTSGTMGWTFYILARRPAIYQKLRQVILEDFGDYAQPKNLDFSSLKSCQYLHHVLNEVLRLHPAVPANERYAVRDTTLPVGGGPDGKSPVFVAKGTAVGYHVHVMHHRKDIWGPDADEFKPERWVGRKSGFEYLPFNAGPRICIGQQHALTLMGFVLVRMLQRYDRLEVADGGAPERHSVGLTTTPTDCVVRLHEA